MKLQNTVSFFASRKTPFSDFFEPPPFPRARRHHHGHGVAFGFRAHWVSLGSALGARAIVTGVGSSSPGHVCTARGEIINRHRRRRRCVRVLRLTVSPLRDVPRVFPGCRPERPPHARASEGVLQGQRPAGRGRGRVQIAHRRHERVAHEGEVGRKVHLCKRSAEKQTAPPGARFVSKKQPRPGDDS